MPLEPVPELLRSARDGGYALGYFESWNLESLRSQISTIEQDVFIFSRSLAENIAFALVFRRLARAARFGP